jgi:alanyl-tRNA synthetase
MKTSAPSGAEIRQTFIDFFLERGHSFVPSSSLVPGGDQTLLFTNSGMVQFKEVFLGTDSRPYTRAVNSQKCLRVAGKHNDLDEVGQNNTHHTFFEMLGNWSFGDYYKEEAIAWAWELFTEVWKLPKDRLWASCFEDEKGEIPRDDEAAQTWLKQPGLDPAHVLFFGRKDNFWEMADTGPCGPNSEIHLDRGPEYCDKPDVAEHVCGVNSDCPRFLELWNLVFIQYNRTGPKSLEPLPATHVDTGMGFERIVSILQGVDSNYMTDLLKPLMDYVMEMTGHTEAERDVHLTPYRVIADHARAAAFLIADGVVPGNTGRNYVCRMIIRRASRFGTKIGLHEPFLSKVANVVIKEYGPFYKELTKNRTSILDNLEREERRFHRTVEGGMVKLENILERLKKTGKKKLSGSEAFELYATYGLPLELTRDVARENNLDVDEQGFLEAMQDHRIASSAGEAFGFLGGEDVEIYRKVAQELLNQGILKAEGVGHDPYRSLEVPGKVLALVKSGVVVNSVSTGDRVEILLPQTCFYAESGGQVSDTGSIISAPEDAKDGERRGEWEIRIDDVRRPAAGIIVHIGEVLRGEPRIGDAAVARVDAQRRVDIMRNHTATHLMHAELREILGENARQAGSLVTPDRLRFDFTHPEPLTQEQLDKIEAAVNHHIFNKYPLKIQHKTLQEAISEGAVALFGEKYAESVRTIAIGGPDPFSYELCGGTHVEDTGDIGVFIITHEGSIAAGIRRIEAVTGRKAYEIIQRRFHALRESAGMLGAVPEESPKKVRQLLEEVNDFRKQITSLKKELAQAEFQRRLEEVENLDGAYLLVAELPGADADTLRQMTDIFRQRYPSGVAVLASVINERPMVVASVSEDLVKRGLHAGELVRETAKSLGGGGGGKPTLAQAGGKDPQKISEALSGAAEWVEEKLKDRA